MGGTFLLSSFCEEGAFSVSSRIKKYIFVCMCVRADECERACGFIVRGNL